MFRKQIQIIPIPYRLVLPSVVLAHLLCAPPLLAQSYEWKVIARPDPAYPLVSVDFADTLHGVIGSGGSSAFYYTSDAGTTWQSSAGAILLPRAIDLVDTSFGWAAGTTGKGFSDIARTTDGGRSWQLLREKFGEEFHGVAGLSPTKCICAGFAANSITPVWDTAMILRTTDGGKAWGRMLFDLGVHLGRLHFVDTLTGWVETDSFYTPYIMKTTDGGTSWQKLITPVMFKALTFLDTLNGWGGESGNFYQTRDGGHSWVFRFGVPFPGDDFGMTTLGFTDTLNGWAFGNAVYLGVITEAIYRTIDGGTTWNRESIGLTAPFGDLEDALMLDRHHGFAVANDGRVLGYQKVPDYVKDPTEHTPLQMQLLQNYPEPFNGFTNIEYHIQCLGPVRLEIMDILGREVATLINQDQAPGVYRIRFDGRELASGPYFYRLVGNSSTIIRKMLIVK